MPFAYNSFFGPPSGFDMGGGIAQSPNALGQYTQANATADAARYGAQGQAIASANNAMGQMGSTLYQQPANFANAFGNVYGSYAGGLGNAFGAYAGGLGNMATAAANERSNLYGANAMAEAARQGALGNMASAGIGAYGSASNAAMNAWAQNQGAYNQSLASMQMANQNALGNLGVSRNAALGGLGGAYGQLGQAESRAQTAGALAGMFGGGGDGSFTAGGVGGPIASGSYAGGGGGGGMVGGMKGGGTRGAMRGVDSLRESLMSNDMTNALAGANTNAMDRLDRQHFTSREMPSQMLGQSLSGLMTLTAQNANGIGAGMDQFYGNQNRAGDQFMGSLDAMRGGLDSAYGGVLGGLGAGYENAGNQIQGMWDNTLGKTTFLTPAEQLEQRRAAAMMARQYGREDEAFYAQDTLRDPGPSNAGYYDHLRKQQNARRTLARLGLA